jgi:hypothetical protein
MYRTAKQAQSTRDLLSDRVVHPIAERENKGFHSDIVDGES